MKIDKFEAEYWLNPLDPIAKYNLGSSCCKPVTVNEMLELTGTDRDWFYKELDSMSLHYGYFEGMPRLKKAIKNLYTDVVTENMILSVHGGSGANSILCHSLCETGHNVVSIIPNYQQFYSIPESLGIEVRKAVSDESIEYSINMDEVKKLVDKNTSMINLANPNNPTGYTLSKNELEELVEVARSVDAYLVIDEIYRGLSDDKYQYSVVDLYEKGICTFGTSKVFSCAGARIGWIITRDMDIFDTIHNYRSYSSICEGSINELITALIVEKSDVFLNRNKEIVDTGRAELNKWIDTQPHLKLACDSTASISLVLYDFDIPAKEFATNLFEKTQTLVCHGGCFGIEKSFRIGYGFGDVDYLKKGLAEIGKFVSELQI